MKRQRQASHLLPLDQHQLATEPRHQSAPLPQPPTFARQDANFQWAAEQAGRDRLAAALVGQAVHGIVERWTDSGFVVAVRVGGLILRGVHSVNIKTQLSY